MSTSTLSLESLVVVPIREMLARMAGFIPTLIGALLILIVGWILAKGIRTLIQRLFTTIRLDTLADKAGLSEVLQKSGIKFTTSQMLTALIYWLVMIMVLVMTVNALGLTVASQLLERLFGYIPNVISAIFVLILGMFFANLISGVVHAACANANVPQSEIISRIARWAIIVFAVTISLEELGVAPLLVGTTFNILFGSVCLAFALAFGLGGRDAAARYLDELRRKR